MGSLSGAAKIEAKRRFDVPKPFQFEDFGKMKFVDKVSKILDRIGWTQQTLEKIADLPPSRFSKWKHGTGKPTISHAFQIARSLGVSLDDLADETKELPTTDHQPMFRRDAILEEMKRRTLDIAKTIGWERAARILDIARVIGPDEAVRRLVASKGGPEGMGDSFHFERDVEEPPPRPIKKKGS